MKHRTALVFLTVLSVFTLLLLFEQGFSPSAFAKTQSLPSPLPLTCASASICANGYVYFDGAPVPTATVKFDGLFGTLTVTTTTGGLSASPYYQANLSGAPLLASSGDVLTITATYNGSSATMTYTVAPGGQQIDAVIVASVLFGNGLDGPLTVSISPTIINSYTALNSTASSGATSLSVSSTSGFVANKEIVIHQTQGTNAGIYEFATIASVGSGTLNLTKPISNTYTQGGQSHAQIVTVPNYTNVTVQSGATLTAPAWNGNTGGILVFRATGTVNAQNTGSLSVSGLGYRAPGNNDSCCTGFQGEGVNGVGGQSYFRNNDGGGGGESPGGGNVGGGGGGGYGSTGEQGSNGSGGSPGLHGGEGGNAKGDANLQTWLMGGAGGSGGDKTDAGIYGGAGGNGSGVLAIFAKSLLVSGTINSNGLKGTEGHVTQAVEAEVQVVRFTC